MKVFVITYEHKQGNQTAIYADYSDADAHLIGIVKRQRELHPELFEDYEDQTDEELSNDWANVTDCEEHMSIEEFEVIPRSERKIVVTRNVPFDDLNWNDQNEFPELEDNISKAYELHNPDLSDEVVLDEFHCAVPIKVLDDFTITVERVK